MGTLHWGGVGGGLPNLDHIYDSSMSFHLYVPSSSSSSSSSSFSVLTFFEEANSNSLVQEPEMQVHNYCNPAAQHKNTFIMCQIMSN